MKKMTTLPAFALVLTLSACGGDGNDPSPSSPLTDCFTVTGTVSFKMIVSNAPSPSGPDKLALLTEEVPSPPSDNPSTTESVSQSVSGPMKYNGENVTGQNFIYTTEDSGKAVTVTKIKTIVWTTKQSGVNLIAEMNTTPPPDGKRIVPDTEFKITLPYDMDANTPPVRGIAFVGIEKEMTLAGTTFSNVCHLKIPKTNGITDLWYARGYGLIKANNLSDPSVPELRYNGRL